MHRIHKKCCISRLLPMHNPINNYWCWSMAILLVSFFIKFNSSVQSSRMHNQQFYWWPTCIYVIKYLILFHFKHLFVLFICHFIFHYVGCIRTAFCIFNNVIFYYFKPVNPFVLQLSKEWFRNKVWFYILKYFICLKTILDNYSR